MGAKAELRCCTLIGAGANAAEEPMRAADRTETSFMVGLLSECEGQARGACRLVENSHEEDLRAYLLVEITWHS